MQTVPMEKRTIFFDPEPHKYYDETGKEYISATTIIGKVTPVFDRDYWLVYKALEKMGYRLRPIKETRSYVIDGMEVSFDNLMASTGPKMVQLRKHFKNIDDLWVKLNQEACEKGNEKHDYLERAINGFTVAERIKNIADLAKKKHWKDTAFKVKIKTNEELQKSSLKKTHPSIYKKLEALIKAGFVIFAEYKVYSSTHRIAGTIDVLAIRGKEFYIIDWKTNKHKMHFKSGYYRKRRAKVNGEWTKVPTGEWVDTNDRLLTPLEHIQECHGEIYTLQLSLYARICELWGMKCLGLELCHLRDGAPKPEWYDIRYRKRDIDLLLAWRLAQIEDEEQ